MANLIYKGSKASLPAERNATSFYLCEDTRELYFGANLYTEAVRFYTTEEGKPTSPAQGVLYVNTNTGTGDVWNGTAWVNVIKGYTTVIDENADDSTVPTSKAAKDYIDQKVEDVVAGSIDGLGALASKDEVTEAELGTDLTNKINGKAEQSALTEEINRAKAAEEANATAAAAAKSAADKAQGEVDAVEERVTVVEGDVSTLKADSATEGSVDYKIAQAVAAIMENPDETMNSINELVTWINDHAADALELSNKVSANEADIAALEELVGTTGVADQITAAIEAALKVDSVDKYALASDLTAAIARIAALEAKAHEHANKAELDKIADGDVAKWNAAEQNAKDYADGLASNYDAAGSAEQALTDAKAYADQAEADAVSAAQTYTDGKNTAMDTRVTAVEAAITVGTF